MVAVAIMAATGGYFVAMILSPATPQQTPAQTAMTAEALAANRVEDLLGQARPDFTLGDLSGNPVSAAEFDGQVVLVNFWATWCTPCIEEMPMLSSLHQIYSDRGFEVVGIALDDPEKAVDFVAQLEIDYPVLVGTTDAILVGRRFGNRAGMLPYSVLVDSEGIVRWSHLGALDREELETRIQSLL